MLLSRTKNGFWCVSFNSTEVIWSEMTNSSTAIVMEETKNTQGARGSTSQVPHQSAVQTSK